MNNIEQLRTAKGYFYLASPYSKWAPDLPREQALDAAAVVIAEVAGAIMKHGITVYSPIVHSHAIALAADIDPLSHEIWLPLDKPMFECAHGLLVAALPGWRDSYGIGEEIKWAAELKKPRFLVDPESLQWQALP